jgi:hypothetical protein
MATNWYDVVHLDRRREVTGTYVNPTTTWTLGFTDNTLNAIVLGPDFGTDFGKIVTPATNSGGTVTFAANYSAGEVMIGRLFTMSTKLTRPYNRRQGDGRAEVAAFLSIQRVHAPYHNTGALDVRADFPDISIVPARTESIDVDPITKRGEDVDIYIENATAKPCTVPSIELIVDYASRVLE